MVAAIGGPKRLSTEVLGIGGGCSRSQRRPPRAIETGGVLFMNCGGEPAEIKRIKTELLAAAESTEQISTCRHEYLGSDAELPVLRAGRGAVSSTHCAPAAASAPGSMANGRRAGRRRIWGLRKFLALRGLSGHAPWFQTHHECAGVRNPLFVNSAHLLDSGETRPAGRSRAQREMRSIKRPAVT